MLYQWGYVNFSNNGDFVHICVVDSDGFRAQKNGYFDTAHTSKISINASLHRQNEAWQQQRPDMNKQQYCQQEVFLRVRGILGLHEWMNARMNGRTYMSNVCVVSDLSKDRQIRMLDYTATIYCYLYLHNFMFAITVLPFNLISPHISYENMERCFMIATTMWVKWVRMSLDPFG